MQDLVDLHCHYIPAVDDGVRTEQEGMELCQALKQLGYSTVVATPHIRTAMFENRKADLSERFAQFAARAAGVAGMPELLLGAEHFVDDVFWRLFESDEALPYTGGNAALIELPPDQVPLGLDQRVFRMRVRGLCPVLAHPERYPSLFGSSAPIERALEVGAVALLDLMSLTGKYGKRPRQTAERMLEEGMYYAACTDCHRPADAEHVAEGIERLRELVGGEDAAVMLSAHPRAILRGEVES
jgi:protein-tyrosine phosphatase